MALIIEIKVVPGAKKRHCKIESDRLKCYLQSPPEKGKANKELISLLAKALKLPASRIALISGATNRLKRIEIDAEITLDHLYDALGIERQMRMF